MLAAPMVAVILILIPAILVPAIARGEATSHLRATMIGIVLPADARPGERVSAIVTTHPKRYAGVAALRVVELATPARTRATLQGLVVETGDHKRHPADAPLVVMMPPAGGALALSLVSEETHQRVGETSIPVESLPPHPARAGTSLGTFTMLPFLYADAVVAIHGPFEGNSTNTKIAVNGRPARIIAESPRAAYFELPGNTPAGAAKVELKEGGRTVWFTPSVIEIRLSADRLALHRGETTRFHAEVTGLNSSSARDWRAGNPSETASAAGAAAATPSGAGNISIVIRNTTPEIVQMENAPGNAITRHISRDEASAGTVRIDGTLDGLSEGEFGLEAEAIPSVADAPGIEQPPTTVAKNEATPKPSKPHAEKTPTIEDDQSEDGEHELHEDVPVVPPIVVEQPTPALVAPPPRADDCPQRHKGCIALIINFLKEKPKKRDWSKFGTSEFDYWAPQLGDALLGVPEGLKKVGCELDEVNAFFDPVPQPVTIQLFGAPPVTIKPIPEFVKAALDNNKHQWGNVYRGVLKHRADIQKDHEIAIEIVLAHGGDRPDFGECGSWGMNYPIGRWGDLRRWNFHLGNYWLGRKHLCDWAVFDGSCFSGLTPQAVDELENFSPAGHCDGPETIECPQHAAWEGDFATGTAPSTTSCIGFHLMMQFAEVHRQLSAQKAKYDAAGGNYDYSSLMDAFRKATRETISDAEKGPNDKWKPNPSYYMDGGYWGDRNGASHAVRGYPQPRARKVRH